ncbi:CLUMA_CG008062, isoform A [Clunio marinus]|uniref:CLUMA_CG008062, isoform A n=1 Tax=Clunio marinus TaxID=568069 RepID=A0A1J1I830_9DIPT|nr:CLUMA_CG008062, isoform A [Clunio marinus]
MINESYDGKETPNKKRKRECISRFVSSTPIKTANKENFAFSDSLCMEVKSIAELVAERNSSKLQKANDFEVIRKPPKKKKKNSEECCFVNPCLDLKVNEKVINPFEVVRSDKSEAIKLAHGVSNAGLDVDALPEQIDASKTSTNPFEVVREIELPKEVKGIDNSALEINPPTHTPLMLPLPFTPTVNHRIDFSQMPCNLTPVTLLTSKLVLENNETEAAIGTPKKIPTINARKSLSVISEEAEIDIKQELDNYQLQLENSINEAKLQNRKFELNKTEANQEKPETKEEEENKAVSTSVAVVNNATYTKETVECCSIKEVTSITVEVRRETNIDDDNNDDVQFEEVDSFEDDIGKLGQFKRAYRVEAPSTFKRPTSKTSTETQPKKLNLGGSIRRSIRKFINHKSDKTNEDESDKHGGIFETIRHSLRRKPKPKAEPVNFENSVMGRAVFKQTSTEDGPKKTLERSTLKRHVVKTMKTFMENVEEFDHY